MVVPRKALHRKWHPDFEQLLDEHDTSLDMFWESIARWFQSQRVVSRAEIDPDSPTRQCQFEVLFCAGQPTHPGWITVTENSIRQSFDLTRVMFSRGNVTEKRRFGCELVQPDEMVLDLYAGIGYFTLQALVLGKARHVTCCE